MRTYSDARSGERGGYSMKPSVQSTCFARSHQERIKLHNGSAGLTHLAEGDTPHLQSLL